MRDLPSLLIGIGKKEKEEESGSEYDEAFNDAFEEYHAANKSGDSKAAREAFKAAVKICAMSEDEAEGDY